MNDRAALDGVFACAQRLRDTWRADRPCDEYVRAINAVCREVDAVEKRMKRPRRAPKPAKRKARR